MKQLFACESCSVALHACVAVLCTTDRHTAIWQRMSTGCCGSCLLCMRLALLLLVCASSSALENIWTWLIPSSNRCENDLKLCGVTSSPAMLAPTTLIMLLTTKIIITASTSTTSNGENDDGNCKHCISFLCGTPMNCHGFRPQAPASDPKH